MRFELPRSLTRLLETGFGLRRSEDSQGTTRSVSFNWSRPPAPKPATYRGGPIVTMRDIQRVRLQSQQQHEEDMRTLKQIVVKGLDSLAFVQQLNNFRMKMGDLDYTNLFLEVSGPSHVDFSHSIQDGGKVVKFQFQVERSGEYSFRIRYLGAPVPGSPFLVLVKDLPLANSSCAQPILAHGKGLRLSSVGRGATFKVNTWGLSETREGPLEVFIEGPDGSEGSPATCTPSRYGCQVDYMTEVEGMHWVHVKWDGKHIRGSPFEVKSVRRAHRQHSSILA